MRHPEADEEFRTEVCDWFRANGVDPSRLPQDPHASIDGARLTFRQAVSDSTGRAQVDPVNPNRILTEVVTVPLVVEPPFDVAEWLRPKCPTCGR